MIGQELILKFKNNQAFLTDYSPLSLDEVELGSLAKKRGIKGPAFWEIKVLSCNLESDRINVQILSYNLGLAEYSTFQKNIEDKLSGIKRIVFKGIDTKGLLMTISGKGTGTYIPAKVTSADSIHERSGHNSADSQKAKFSDEPLIVKSDESFEVPIKKVHFRNGYVEFEKKIKQFKEPIVFTIENQNIVAEFDAIKNYFSNILNTKKILVSVALFRTESQIISKEAVSPEIDKIEKDIIETVKLEYIRVMSKKASAELEKSPVPLEDFFNRISEAKVSFKAFYKDEKQYFEDLLRVKKSKHYNHLRYLSSKHAHDVMKLRILLKPFSFIFLVIEKLQFHFIWETLETSEATYLWSFDKDEAPRPAYQKIEAYIIKMKEQGKTHYISAKDADFTRVFHIYTEGADGFLQWKADMDKLLSSV